MTSVVLLPADLAAQVKRVEVAIEPDALYPADQAALILGYDGARKSRQGRMYAIPEKELRRYRSGPNGGRWRWLGRDLLQYRERVAQQWRRAG